MGISTATSTHARSRGVRASRHPHLLHCRRVCAVYHARTTTSSHTPRPQRARKIARSGRHPGSTAENAAAVRGNPGATHRFGFLLELPPAFACRGSRTLVSLSKTPAVLTSTRHASETTTAPGCCGGLTNPGAAETPRATLFFLELPLVSPCAQTSLYFVQFGPVCACWACCKWVSFNVSFTPPCQFFRGFRLFRPFLIFIVGYSEPSRLPVLCFVGAFGVVLSINKPLSDGMETGRYSLSHHPIWGRVLARHERARGAAFADDSYIYATLKAALQVLAEIRANGFGKTRNLVSICPR